MENMKRVLFVDDEANVLDGIRRVMHPMRQEWETQFASSAEEALSILAENDFDVIVSDIRMPGTDGAELLAEVQDRYPQMVRIALSGQADKDVITRSVGPIHQYLSKPCEPDTLKAAIVRSTALRGLLRSEKVKRVISGAGTLPSLPSLYTELMEEISKPDSSIQAVEKIISKDLGMSTKVMQLVNSAFFGVRRHVSNPTQAVALLGLDTIEALVLSVQVFSQFDGMIWKGLSIETLWSHSMDVSACSKAIARMETKDSKLIDNAFLGGLLHDVGSLILAARLPRNYKDVFRLAESKRISTIKAEVEVLGTTHAEVGAYLLGLWGFSDPIVEAVAFHHNPLPQLVEPFAPLTSVFAGDMLAHEIREAKEGNPFDSYDMERFSSLGLSEKVPEWREACIDALKDREEEK